MHMRNGVQGEEGSSEGAMQLDFRNSSHTIEQLVGELYPLLGVPHFQRGQVWSAEAKSLLLKTPSRDLVFIGCLPPTESWL